MNLSVSGSLFRVILTVLLFSVCAQVFATRLYVDVAAVSGSRNGSSWSNAYTRLDSALMNSFSGDTLWIMKGRYFPVGSKTSAYFNIPSGRKIYGGFDGTENSISDRDLQNNITYLDGDIGTKTQASDNSMNVVRLSNAGSTTILNGLHIVNGYAYSAGGGIGVGGGGMRVTAGSPNFEFCVFEDNYTYMRGGAVYIENSAVPIFRNCDFVNNNTGNDVNSFGGAIFSNSGSAYYYDCRFISNYSQRGGAVTLNSNGYFSRCVFTNNRSVNGSGAVVYCFDAGSLSAYNCLIAGNSASSTSIVHISAVFNTNVHYIVNCTIADNAVSGSNSVTLEDNSNTYIRNSIIWNNSANSQIYFYPSVTLPIVRNCIVSGGYAYGSNISSANPRFKNPSSPQNAPFDATVNDYKPDAGSPAIDAGDSTFLNTNHKKDLNNVLRIRNNNTDIGAYESPYSAWTVTVTSDLYGSAEGGGIYPADSFATVKAKEGNCGVFSRWTRNGFEVSTDSIYTFAVDSHCNLKAEFTRRQFNINASVSPAASGSVTHTGIYFCSDSTYVLSAVPSKCFKFKEWRENGQSISTTANLSFKPDQNHSYTAVFEPVFYTITVAVSPLNSGTISGAGNIACDSTVTLLAKARPGFVFSNWKAGNTNLGSDTLLQFTASFNRNITANFNPVSGLDEFSKKRTLYPNPTQRFLYTGTFETIEFRINDLAGKCLMSGSACEIIDLEGLESGMFIIELLYPDKACMKMLFIKS